MQLHQGEKSMSKSLFPPYLNQGSTGPAVNVLAWLMKSYQYGDPDKILMDGEYTPGGEIAKAVMEFQSDCNLSVDGNFGPKERASLEEEFALDLDLLTDDMFVGETVAVGPKHE
jgi:peptidoglycan hydrolase-like protein with peptidoglycan-binding domain